MRTQIASFLAFACCLQIGWAAKPSKFKAPQWKNGPCTIRFDKMATLDLPQGMRYLPAAEVAKFYEAATPTDRVEQPVLISPIDGDWTFCARFIQGGRTRQDLTPKSLDTWHTEFQQTMESDARRSGVERVYFQMTWPLVPFLDKDQDAVGYGWTSCFQPYMTTDPNELMSRSMLFESLTKQSEATFIKLGRRGHIVMTIYSGDPASSDLEKAASLIRGIQFADGERWRDYQNGDKMSDKPLSALLQANLAMNLSVKVDLPDRITEDTRNLPTPNDIRPAMEQVQWAQAMDQPKGKEIDFSNATQSGMGTKGCLTGLLKISPILLLALGALWRRSSSE